MLYNYFIIAIRNLLRQRLYSAINILGLAVGVSCVVLIALFVQYELSYDAHFENAERIYRITTTFGSYKTKDAPLPLAQALTERTSDIEAVTRMMWMEPPYPYFNPNEENTFQESRAYYADSTFFNVFNVKFIVGDRRTSLIDVQSVVLSETVAKRYFSNESALNKTIRLDNKTDLKVTGVYQDFPPNSHIHPEVLVSATSSKLMMDNSARNWEWLYSSSTYVLIRKNANIEKFDSRLVGLFWEVTGYTKEAFGSNYSMHLQPLLDIHLHSHYPGENNGNIAVMYTFGGIGFVIILIATINFINLSVVRSLKRAREVGMRKVLGSQRTNIISQFLIESLAMVSISASVAILVACLALPLFNDLVGTSLTLSNIASLKNVIALLTFVVALGLLSGLYPAFFLSGYNPAMVLKGKFTMRTSSIRLRKGLVIVQFGIGFTVLTGTLLVNRQLDFMSSKDLGYTKDNVITIELPNDSIGVDFVRNELMRIPHVVSASKMSESFNNIQSWLVPWYEGAPERNDFSVTRLHTDSYFDEVVGLELLEGRYFNEDFRGDSLSYVLNETAVARLGWKNDEAIGKPFGREKTSGKVIGVVKDFHFRHLSIKIAPFVFFPPSVRRNVYERGRIAVRIESGHTKETTEALNEKWNELVPGWPFKYSHLNEDLTRQYHGEFKLSKLTHVFSALAIFISTLGLFGLASFSIHQRVKEIGIRKVLGADVKSLIIVTTKDTVLLVCIGLTIGIPVAYLSAMQWLNNYAYRVDVTVMPFIIACTISLATAVFTVSSVAMKASIANPVDSLRQE